LFIIQVRKQQILW